MDFNFKSFNEQAPHIKVFEYFLFKLYEWTKEFNSEANNDLSVLKSQKLLFFTVAASLSDEPENILATNIFKDFKAYQFGPVEETIYLHLKENSNSLSNSVLTFSNLTLNFEESTFSSTLDSIKRYSQKDLTLFNQVDKSLSKLKDFNANLVSYSAFHLVELSHQWKCWINAFYNNAPKSSITNRDISAEIMRFSF
ncbi:MAG: DUF4065 domain-containing protein [Pedobacter sp.]|nr:MAG: DUF4065 domain-containing protein [Pedobacter sp.]